jgi:hypothetical protein
MVEEVAENAGGRDQNAIDDVICSLKGSVLHSKVEPISHKTQYDKHHARFFIYECSSNSSRQMFPFQIYLR